MATPDRCVHLNLARGTCMKGLATPDRMPAACETCPQYRGPVRGLGDLVHKVAEATGVARVVKAVTKGDCGCHGRRVALNRRLSFREPAD